MATKNTSWLIKANDPRTKLDIPKLVPSDYLRMDSSGNISIPPAYLTEIFTVDCRGRESIELQITKAFGSQSATARVLNYNHQEIAKFTAVPGKLTVNCTELDTIYIELTQLKSTTWQAINAMFGDPTLYSVPVYRISARVIK